MSCPINTTKAKVELEKQMKPTEFYMRNKGLGTLYDFIARNTFGMQDVAQVVRKELKPIWQILSSVRQTRNFIQSTAGEHLSLAKQLSDEHRAILNQKIGEGDISGVKFTPSELKAQGIPDEVIAAYRSFQELNTYAMQVEMRDIPNARLNKSGFNKEDLDNVLDTYIASFERARTNKELIDMKPKNLSPAQSKAWDFLKKKYNVGWANRLREGDKFVKIEVAGKTIYRQHYDALTHGENQKVIDHANSIAQEKVDAFVMQERGRLSKISDNISSALAIAENKGNMKRADKLRAKLAKVEEDLRYLDNPEAKVTSGDIDEKVYNPSNLDYSATVEYINDIEKDLIAKANPKSQAEVENIKAIVEGLRQSAEREYKSTTFARHTIKRSKHTVEGYSDDFVKAADRYISNLSNSVSRQRASIDAIPYLTEMANNPVSLKMAQKNIQEAFRGMDKFEKSMNLVNVSTYTLQFMGNIKSGIVNVFGAFPQMMGEFNYYGLSSAHGMKTMKDSFALGSKIMFQQAHNLGKGDKAKSINQIIDDIDFGFKDNEVKFKEDLKRELMEGLSFDITQQELQEMGSKLDSARKVVDATMIFQRKTEQLARISSYIAGYKASIDSNGKVIRIAKERGDFKYLIDKGIEPSADDFASMFADNVNSVYGALNRGRIAQGGGWGSVARAAFPMQNFALHAIGLHLKYAQGTVDFIKHKMGNQKLSDPELEMAYASAIALRNTTLGYVAVGGLGSVPAIAAIDKIYEQFISEDKVSVVSQLKMNENAIINSLANGGLSTVVGDTSGSFQFQVPYLSGSLPADKILKHWGSDNISMGMPRNDLSMYVIDNYLAPEVMKNIVRGMTDRDLQTRYGAEKELDGEVVSRDTWQSFSKMLGLERSDISSKKMRMYVQDSIERTITKQKALLNSKYSDGDDIYEEEDELNEKIDYINNKYGLDLSSYSPKEREAREYEID